MYGERDTAYVDICPFCAGQNESGIAECRYCGWPAGKDWETVLVDLDTRVIVRTVIPAQKEDLMSDKYIDLDRVLDEESWDFLNTNYPSLAMAVQRAVEQGMTPEIIRQRIVHRLGAHREALAQRCELAARHLERSE
jgi:hypothetical protein